MIEIYDDPILPGRFTGAKLALKPMHVWAVRVRLQVAELHRDIALFDIALDSKLRGCDVVSLRLSDVLSAGAVKRPSDLSRHNALVYSSVQGDDVWHFTSPGGERLATPVKGRFRSNNLSAVLAACRDGLGVAALPRYVASESLRSGKVVELLKDYQLPDLELHAVFPSPKRVPAKVLAFVSFAQSRFVDGWWNARNGDVK